MKIIEYKPGLFRVEINGIVVKTRFKSFQSADDWIFNMLADWSESVLNR